MSHDEDFTPPTFATEMSIQQARGGHCTRGGTIASGAAVCECGTWSAAAFPNALARTLARKQQHLNQVAAMRAVGTG
jgi:hypothetical protein